MLIALSAILAIIVIIQGIICFRLKKELEITKRIRMGYEKNFNSFKLKYTVLSKLENKSTVLQNMAGIPQPVYIYGGGVIGNKLLKILQEGGIEVTRVIEGRELKQNPEYGESLNAEQIVIITPMFDYDSIAELLTKYFKRDNIIGIDEIIN